MFVIVLAISFWNSPFGYIHYLMNALNLSISQFALDIFRITKWIEWTKCRLTNRPKHPLEMVFVFISMAHISYLSLWEREKIYMIQNFTIDANWMVKPIVTKMFENVCTVEIDGELCRKKKWFSVNFEFIYFYFAFYFTRDRKRLLYDSIVWLSSTSIFPVFVLY